MSDYLKTVKEFLDQAEQCTEAFGIGGVWVNRKVMEPLQELIKEVERLRGQIEAESMVSDSYRNELTRAEEENKRLREGLLELADDTIPELYANLHPKGAQIEDFDFVFEHIKQALQGDN